jgi:hypothetical protein
MSMGEGRREGSQGTHGREKRCRKDSAGSRKRERERERGERERERKKKAR